VITGRPQYHAHPGSCQVCRVRRRDRRDRQSASRRQRMAWRPTRHQELFAGGFP